ncbi:GDSL esterase/lipase 7-like [Magnolia sinica]|uniref:GDSL esterase/lipase 7-like n=1 Tax=Magnolia sinica TaxID=86752 RepID=UPI0026599A11|nr:GDSL esterase/lipase 7-like [Magnolia sinica]
MNIKKSSMFILIPFLSLLFNALSAKSSEEPLAPALYVLGDSLADSGNNNGLPTQAKANYVPYGIDFNGGVSGRFTNGNTMADFIAQLLGLPLAPPYLGLSEAERSQIITGLNYASGSAGILPETGSRLGKNIPIGEQIDYFQRTVEIDLPRNFTEPQALFNHLSKSIFLVSVGSNDYINNYLQPDYYNSSKYFSPQRFAGLLVDELSQHLTRLYKLGARKIIVFEIGILGCMPSITNTIDFSKDCDKEVNRLVITYNAQLSILLTKLKSLLEGSIFIQGQVFLPGYVIYHSPYYFGEILKHLCLMGRDGF